MSIQRNLNNSCRFAAFSTGSPARIRDSRRSHWTHLRLMTGLLAAAAVGSPAMAGITYVQANYATPQSHQTTVSVPFKAAQLAGDLNVIVVGWNDSVATVQSVTDSIGNTYSLAVGPTVESGYASQSIYYAKNIQAAGAGANAVKVVFNSPATSADIRVLEYSGANQSTPVDVTTSDSGNNGTSYSGSTSTRTAGDLIVGANLVQTASVGPGTGLVERLLTSPDGDIVEDEIASAVSSYSASAPLTAAGPWIMQMVAFRPASGSTPPPAPSGHEVNLTWEDSTSSNVVSYNVYRANGTGTSYAQIADGVTGAAYTDTSVTADSTYTYVVTAVNNSGDESAYSNSQTVTVP